MLNHHSRNPIWSWPEVLGHDSLTGKELTSLRVAIMIGLLLGLLLQNSGFLIWLQEVEPGTNFSFEKQRTRGNPGSGMRRCTVSE